MKHMKFDRLALLALLVVSALAVTAQAGVVIIANPGVAGDSVSGSELQKIFLGKTTSWPDGTAAKPAVVKNGPVTEEFIKTFVRKSPSQFKTFWKKAMFSGTGTPPAELKTEADMVAFVAGTPGAVGYVSEGVDTAGTKVLGVE